MFPIVLLIIFALALAAFFIFAFIEALRLLAIALVVMGLLVLIG